MSHAPHRRWTEQLHRWRHLEECLIHELRWTRGLYDADLAFNYVRDAHGNVRDRVLEEPVLVTFRLVGIEALRFVGALTEGMKTAPEQINWGLAEVSGVQIEDRGELMQLVVSWESERRLEVACVSIELVEPSATDSGWS